MRDFGLSLLSSWELRCSGLLGYSLLNNPEQCSSQLKKSVFNSWKISMRLQDKRTSASIKQCRTEHPCFLAKERPLDCSCSYYYYYYYIMIGGGKIFQESRNTSKNSSCRQSEVKQVPGKTHKCQLPPYKIKPPGRSGARDLCTLLLFFLLLGLGG